MQISNNNNSEIIKFLYLTTAYANSTVAISFINIHTQHDVQDTRHNIKYTFFHFCRCGALSMFPYNFQAYLCNQVKKSL